MKQKMKRNAKNPPVVYRGDTVRITTKKRTFEAKAIRDFSPAHSMVYPVMDTDGGGQKLALSYQDVISIELLDEEDK